MAKFVEHFFHLNKDAIGLVRQIKFPPDAYPYISEFLYFKNYSRLDQETGRQETWPDTVVRIVNGVFSIRKDWYTKNHLRWDERYWQSYATDFAVSLALMEWSPPGRGLFAMGTSLIYERGAMALFNCAYRKISDDLADCISWLADLLMHGVGCGYDSVRSDALTLFEPDGPEVIWQIPDSREGWVESIWMLVAAYQHPHSVRWKFDYSIIRPAGVLIKTFGGTASGPDPLRMLHDRIRQLCDRYVRGDRLGGVTYDSVMLKTDLADCVGVCVVMGNLRRSAMLAMGSVHDQVYLDLKDYTRFPYRSEFAWMSNHTARLKTHDDFAQLGEIARRVVHNGEPGYLNMVNVRQARVGKAMDGLREDEADGLNPCSRWDTLVLTRDGERQIKELADSGEAFDVWNGETWSRTTAHVTGRNQPLLRVVLSGGQSLCCTIDHEWLVGSSVSSARRLPARVLVVGDRIVPYNMPDGSIRSQTVVSIERVAESEPEVYCFTERLRHTGCFNGIVTGQCGEIPLEDGEVCNVDETYPTRCKTTAGWLAACKHAAFYASTVALLPTHVPLTNAVVARNRRTGTSIVDFTGWKHTHGVYKLTRWMRDGYDVIREENRRLAREAGIPESIRVTTIKPGGTTPKVAGRTSGIGYPNFTYMVRRILVSPHDPCFGLLKYAGVPHEKSVADPSAFCFEFPLKCGPARPAAEISLWEQAMNLVLVQREWADNAVSNTLNFTAAERDHVEAVLSAIAPLTKSVSLLPHCEAGVYPQMPEQGISEDEYRKRFAALKSIDWSGLRGSDGQDQKFCDGDVCQMITPSRPEALL